MGRSLWADLIQPPYLRYWETPSPGTLTNVHIGTCLVSHRAGVRMKCSHSQSSALVTKPHRSMVYMLFSHGDWEDGTGKWAPQPTDEGVCACVCVCTCAHTRECAKRAAKCPWAGHGETEHSSWEQLALKSDHWEPNRGSLISPAVWLWAIYFNLLASISSSVKRVAVSTSSDCTEN